MKSIVEAFEACVRAAPDNEAIIVENENRICYKDLDAAATVLSESISQCIHRAEERGGSGSGGSVSTPLVSVMMERDVGAIAAYLAVLKAGAAFVPVDPAFPPDRQAYIFAHSQCQLLITDEQSFVKLQALKVAIPDRYIVIHSGSAVLKSVVEYGVLLDLHSGAAEIRAYSQWKLVPHSVPRLMYVLYTSGSTGKPKGVMVGEKGVLNLLQYFINELGMSNGTKVMNVTTFCFDISMLEIFAPLVSGGCIVMARSQRDPFAIIDLIEKHEVTVFQATPTTYETMLAAGWTGDSRVHFLVGGEAFRPNLIDIGTNCASFRNVYGPTETTIWSTCYTIATDSKLAPDCSLPLPIGHPIDNTLCYVVEPDSSPLKLVSPGEEGELLIAGVGVAVGYMHNVEMTAEKFLADPFDGGNVKVGLASMLYRTGDVVRELLGDDGAATGSYMFERRIDDQVKVDGFRIELGEVESVYAQESDLIEKAVVLVRQNKVVLYLKFNSSVKLLSGKGTSEFAAPLTVDKEVLDSIHGRAALKLAHYMIPRYTVIVREFLQTPNGKLDKKALPDPPELIAAASAVKRTDAEEWSKRITGSSVDVTKEPRSMVSAICNIIEQMRGVRPHANTSMASYGLDSLGSVMFFRQLQVQIGTDIKFSMKDVFGPGTTVRSLAALLCSKLTPEQMKDRNISCECDEEDNSSFEERDQFGDELNSNARLFEGLRGLFTAMVLWNHWHDMSVPLNPAFDVDTTLFVIISGYSTALQLRTAPDYSTNVVTGDKELILPSSFPLKKFVMSRMVGIFPILWLALIINIPVWYAQNHYGDGPATKNHLPGIDMNAEALTCAGLYVIGMNVYDRPACTIYGPDVWYASFIFNTFLIYGMGRWLVTELSIRAIKWCDYKALARETKQFTAPLSNGSANFFSYEGAGRIATYLAYNIYDETIFHSFSVVSTMAILFLFTLTYLLQGYLKVNALSSRLICLFPYFFAGVLLASVAEMWSKRRTRKLVERASTNAVETNVDTAVSSAAISQDNYAPLEVTLEDGFGHVDHVVTTVPHRYGVVAQLLWRFSPDLIVGTGALFLCNISPLDSMPVANVTIWITIPILALAFILISSHQKGVERRNLSRLILELPVVNVMGVSSYPIYILQNAVLMYYFANLYHFDGYHDGFRFHQDAPSRRYFPKDLPLFIRFIYVGALIVGCWLIQQYYQGYLVTRAYGFMINWIDSFKRPVCAEKSFSVVAPENVSNEIAVPSIRNEDVSALAVV